jgi:hypothetical protein
MNNNKAICPICKNKLTEHSELQDKICNMIIIKQFANKAGSWTSRVRIQDRRKREPNKL